MEGWKCMRQSYQGGEQRISNLLGSLTITLTTKVLGVGKENEENLDRKNED